MSAPVLKKKPMFSKARLRTEYPLYLMMLVPAVIVFIYNYIPMAGISIAFMKYLPAKGFWGSKWVGLKNFTTLFKMANFVGVMENTIVIAVLKIVLGIVVPVTITLMLNDLSSQRYKKGIQTIIYMPHFISWVMLSSIFAKLLSGNGVVNQLLGILGVDPIIFMGDNQWFRFTLVFTHVWKEFGYGTIVYLAAVAGIDTELYEAAEIDGAGHWQRMLHVTLPGIAPTIVMMSALSLGNVLNAGFDQVFNMYNPLVYESGDILDTLTYRMGFESGNFGLSSAASLFKSLISAVLLIASYRIADKTVGYKIF